jgi:hypothetical protein
VDYLLLLTRSDEDQATSRRLSQQLPTWLTACAGQLQARTDAADRDADVSSVECGMVLQFVYDAVARSRSAGGQNIYSIWRKLLRESFRRGASGATPAEFLASSADARHICQGLMDGSMDWPRFAGELGQVGVRLTVIPGGSAPEFEVRLLEHFGE